MVLGEVAPGTRWLQVALATGHWGKQKDHLEPGQATGGLWSL